MDYLHRLQLDIAEHLDRGEYFVDIPVLSQAKGVTEASIDEALGSFKQKGGKNGAVAVVLMPVLSVDSPDLPGPTGTLTFTVRVFERTMVARAATGVGKTAEAIALEVLAALHLWYSGAALLSAAPAAIVPYDAAPPGVVGYDVNFSTNQVGAPIPAKCSMPTISLSGSGAGQTATITGYSPAGAQLFYSLDESYPSLPYTVPVVVGASFTVRAIARSTGYRVSDVQILSK